MASSGQRTALVTGAAGFIGSHLVEALLRQGMRVIGLDNLSTGRRANLKFVRAAVKREQWNLFTFVDGDIRDAKLCQQTCVGVDSVFHLAALASVPQSISQPELVHDVNTSGFLNVLIAAKDNQVSHFVFASSSAVYGDHGEGTVSESNACAPLSPYAATKLANEFYAQAFSASYAMRTIALRFFNVYGPRQISTGPYASVIPLWIEALASDRPATLFGDGTATRSFCYVKDVVQACLRTIGGRREPGFRAYNVAGQSAIAMADVYPLLREVVARKVPGASELELIKAPARSGDILHSRADTRLFAEVFGACDETSLKAGLSETVDAFLRDHDFHVGLKSSRKPRIELV